MIAKIIKGKGFRGLANYLLAEDRSRIIGGTMAGSTPRELSAEFAQFRKLRPTLGRAVVHISLSASPDDPPMDDQRWREIAQRVLSGLGYGDCAQLVVRHRDDETEHEHIHLIASCIDTAGRTVTDSNDFRRAETILRQIETDFSLKSVASPSLRQPKNTTINTTKTTKEEHMTDQNIPNQPITIPDPLNVGTDNSAHAFSMLHGATVVTCFAGDNPTAKQKRDFRRITRDKNYEHMMRTVFAEQGLRVYSHDGGAVIYFERPEKSRINDDGDRLTAYGMDNKIAAERLIALANSRGWTSIVFNGSDDFVEMAIRMAIANGMSVHPASPAQRAILDRIMAEGGCGASGAPALTPTVEHVALPNKLPLPVKESESLSDEKQPFPPELPLMDFRARLAQRRQQADAFNDLPAKPQRPPNI